MKKILICLSLLILFTGCSRNISHIKNEVITSSIDFSKYLEKGFLITPGEYGGNYNALGIFVFTVYPDANLETKQYKAADGTRAESSRWFVTKIKTQEVIDIAYKTAIDKGADGITNFKIRNINKTINDGVGIVSIDGIEIEGLLIKRISKN